MNTPKRDALYLIDGKLPESFEHFADLARRFETEYYATLIYHAPIDEPFRVVDGDKTYFVYVVHGDGFMDGIWIFEDTIHIDSLEVKYDQSRALGKWSLMFVYEDDLALYGLTPEIMAAEYSTVQAHELITSIHGIHVPCAEVGLDQRGYDLICLCLRAIMAWFDEHGQLMHRHQLEIASSTLRESDRHVEVTFICPEGLLGQCLSVITPEQSAQKYGFDPYWTPRYGYMQDLIDGFDYVDRFMALFEISAEREAYLKAGHQPGNLPYVLVHAMRSEWASPFWLRAKDLRTVLRQELIKDPRVPACDVHMFLAELRAFFAFLRSTFGYVRPCVDALLNSVDFAAEMEQHYRRFGQHRPQRRVKSTHANTRDDRAGRPRLPRSQRRRRRRSMVN